MVALLSVVVLSFLLSTAHCSQNGNFTPPAASILQYIPLVDVYPATRYGAVVGIIQDTSSYGFVLLGGSLAYGDDTRGWSYKIDKNVSKWTPLATKFSVSSACYAQDLSDSTLKDFIYIYGGTEAKTNNDLYQYQISKDVLTKIDLPVDGRPPTQGATCGIRNGTFYIFGGDCTSDIYSFVTSAKTPQWVKITAENGPTRKGASGLIVGDEFVVWGGNCKTGDDNNDVWRFNLLTKAWASEQATSHQGPDARSYHAAVVDSITTVPSFIIFGGEVAKQTMNDSWVYNLEAKNWTKLNPVVTHNDKWDMIPPRMSANIAYVFGRMFIFSGLVSTNTTANDFWELVLTSDCYKLTASCGACVITDGCGWCSGNGKGYQCIPGRDNLPYINGTCTAAPDDEDRPYINDLCPPEGFPGWIIALIIVVTILVIGVAWYFVIRCQKKSSGYDQIN